MAVEQALQATEQAAATGPAARIAAAIGFATAASLSGTAARLSGTGGFAARFAAAARLAAATIAVEQALQAAQQAAATGLAARIAAARFATAAGLAATARFATASRLTTTTVAVEQTESRSAVGAREHNGGAQDQRRGKETQVHRETPKTNVTGGKHTLMRRAARNRRVRLGRLRMERMSNATSDRRVGKTT